MAESPADLTGRLSRGPAFLFLGQSHLASAGRRDPFLAEIHRKYLRTDEALPGYQALLDVIPAAAADSTLAWMDERCRHLAVPEATAVLATFPWSAVLTTAIDSILPRSLRSQWRAVQPLFEPEQQPRDPRNRFRLNLTFLFGCVNQTEPPRRPPLTAMEWRKRRQVALTLARRIPELLTPFGVLLIEGYQHDTDWLPFAEFAPILDDLQPGQAFFFGASRAFLDDPDAKALSESGKLEATEEPLATFLLAAQNSGRLRLEAPESRDDTGKRVYIGEGLVGVPRDLWHQVTRSAVLLDARVLDEPPPLSDDALYHEFRNFLGSSDGLPAWQAYARGFAFPRDFEESLHDEAGLHNKVRRHLADRTLHEQPFILHGQTGTGKTVALGRLAFEVCKTRIYPVLYIERKTTRPVPSDIDRFCLWAEESGAPATLVVWDGMLGLDDYSDLLRYLTSRGRKVVLIGSSYRIREVNTPQSSLSYAPPELTAAEVTRFGAFLGRFHPSLEELLSQGRVALDSTFLVALYRLLPATHGRIRSGLVLEMDAAERSILAAAEGNLQEVARQTTLGSALVRAGLITGELLVSSPEPTTSEEPGREMQLLTGLVMTPGQFGLHVPVELLLRSMGSRGVGGLRELLDTVDIFRVFEDELGNVDLGPRVPLEAALVVQARMGGPDSEIQFATRLLSNVTERGIAFGEAREIAFAVDLVRALGPQGTKREYYLLHFRSLAETLGRIREERGIENPRLMLQEANLAREWCLEQARYSGGELDAVPAVLSTVEGVLLRALEIVGVDDRRRSLRSSLLVELASALAALARHTGESSENRQTAIEIYQRSRLALHEARVQDPSNYYPIDVLFWSTRDLINTDLLDEKARAEAIADVLSAFETAQPEEFDSEQRERFQRRRLEAGNLLGDSQLADDAFEALRRSGSKAGFYLRALQLSGLSGHRTGPETHDRQKLEVALEYLNGQRTEIGEDARCLDLMLDLWWMVQTRNRIFARERLVVALARDAWQDCFRIVSSIESTGKSSRPLPLAFLRGLCLFHLGQVRDCLAVFRDLEMQSDRIRGRRRIVRSYLASTESGAPQKFHGTVSSLSRSLRRGEVYVEELRLELPFIPQDFKLPDVNPGESLPEFHVAFNYRGAIADPVEYLRR